MSGTQADSGSEDDRGDRFKRLLMKTEVYLSYRLYNQATRAIDELLEIDPECLVGHERLLQVQEATGERLEAAETLVRLAWLLSDQPEEANLRLRKARHYAEDEEVIAIADALGLKLNQVLRVSDGTFVAADPPDEWPFRKEDGGGFERRWLFRALTAPPELYLIRSRPSGEPEAFARSLAMSAVGFPLNSTRKAMLFVEENSTFAVFQADEFIAVHELALHATAVIVGKIRQQYKWETDR